MIIEKDYEYKPSWLMISLCGLMFIVATIILAIKAMNNDRGLIINHIIELTKSEATIFYWVLCFLSFCFVLIIIGLIFHRLKYNQRIALTETGLIVPVSRWSANEKTIEYKNIFRLETAKISGQKFLYVVHSDGKYVINYNMLPSKQAFQEIIEILSQRIT